MVRIDKNRALTPKELLSRARAKQSLLHRSSLGLVVGKF